MALLLRGGIAHSGLLHSLSCHIDQAQLEVLVLARRHVPIRGHYTRGVEHLL